MTVLCTGGAGSIGSNLVLRLLEERYRVIAFDNNEYALACLQEKASGKPLQIAFGDIRDCERLKEVLRGVRTVVHLAAMKRVEMSEPNIVESIKVNVLGTINLLQECRKANVEKLLLISSDKAVPTDGEIGNYGITKLLQERIALGTPPPPICSIARMGNVIGTRGDVFEIWETQKKEGKRLTITDSGMYRYFWHMSEAVEFIIRCLGIMKGAEIFVPIMEEKSLIEMMQHWFPESDFSLIGTRPGELLRHELMTKKEKMRARRDSWGWVIRQ